MNKKLCGHSSSSWGGHKSVLLHIERTVLQSKAYDEINNCFLKVICKIWRLNCFENECKVWNVLDIEFWEAFLKD